MKHAAIVIALFAGFFLLARGNAPDWPYGYDEADYMYAASRGPVANLFDSPTLGWQEFLETGLTAGKDPGRRSDLSERIRSSDDIVFYRHWHGPLYTYWLQFASEFAHSEKSLRAWNYVFPLFTAMAMYFGILWIFADPHLTIRSRPERQLAPVLACVLFLWSYAVIASTELAPHQLFAFCSTVALIFTGKLMLTGKRQYWYAAVVAAAVTFCVLEVAFVLILVLLMCGHLERFRLKADVRFAVISIALFAATVLVIWPAAIFKLSFVKAYLFMAYLAVFRKAAWGSNIGVWGTWKLRFEASPVHWVLIASGLLLVLVKWREHRVRRAAIPFSVFAILMILATFRVNTEIPRYALVFLPALYVTTAFIWSAMLANAKPALQGAMAVICSALLFATTWKELQKHRPDRNGGAFALLTVIRHHGLEDKRLLVKQGDVPTLHYYFPRSRLRGYVDEQAIPAELSRGGLDAVIYGQNRVRYLAAQEVH